MPYVVKKLNLLIALFICGAFMLGLHLWPASSWFVVDKVFVANGNNGMPAMVVDRTVVRRFYGTWTVSIRRWDGGWVPQCTATGSTNYKPDSKLPRDMDLSWWTTMQCVPLKPGRYDLTTRWVVHGVGLLPDKTVEIDSNVFEVTQ